MTSVTRKLRFPENDEVVTTVIKDANEASHYISEFVDIVSTDSKTYGCLGYVGLEVNKAYHEGSGGITEKVSLITLFQFRCLIFQLHRFERIPRSLVMLLQLPELVFCSVGMKCCSESLKRDYGLVIRNAVSFVLRPQREEEPDLPFRNVRSTSSLLLGSWDQTNLSDEQILHVATNAYSYWRTASEDYHGKAFFAV